ncbi:MULTISPECIES: hypothetical protein [unclassified Limnobacter]|jgi:hypothetical protein|uniref:hypothetical protein n=1 Tax=unclassified Limnobacter TaxID=2630203 RepID=UPI000C5A3AA7|nr:MULTISPECIES: hypothetical protein [unclassified Limnobacter]MAG81638.1 hypothetical protein [Sutterellaceae bacterium]MBA4313860.1 hypothetical protein [Alcaligenaceae bacterium]MBT85809.1 hypothetical protein [Sutterellaceae bacterium]|tara:strand:+ start:18440 stop:19312 length:873 start_codon:yes stop_codon:yes gene_type:complete
MSDQDKPEIHEEPAAIPFSEFLESVPPGTLTNITDLTKTRHYQGGGVAGYVLFTPEIQLHCPSDSCNGIRFFRRTNSSVPDIPDDTFHFLYLSYVCSNCRKTEKTFSLAAQRDVKAISGKCYKFGELPEYGPPTAARLIKLIGPDRELFLKGRRCENQGLGIGAFVYYRRVVEEQKNRILDEVIKVSQKVGAPAEAIKTLEAAKVETQFSKALANVKDAIPQALLINGHNPLTLLHSALSDGLHLRSDEHCLEIASSIRVILAELSERLAQALKDEAELNKALSRLMAKK